MGDVYAQIGFEARRCGTYNDGLGRVAEIGKLHQLIQTVIGRQRGVEQHIGQVARAQQIQPATHLHLIQRTLHACEHIHISLTPGDGVGFLLRIDQQQVLGTHAEVDMDMVGVGEVYLAHHVQRFLIIGIKSEVLEQQMRAYDTDGVVIKPHANAVGDTDEIGRIDIHFPIDIGMNQTAMNVEGAIAVTFQTDDLIRNETVDE